MAVGDQGVAHATAMGMSGWPCRGVRSNVCRDWTRPGLAPLHRRRGSHAHKGPRAGQVTVFAGISWAGWCDQSTTRCCVSPETKVSACTRSSVAHAIAGWLASPAAQVAHALSECPPTGWLLASPKTARHLITLIRRLETQRAHSSYGSRSWIAAQFD
jgi:hypothetical protein